jgi:hypothetical protein
VQLLVDHSMRLCNDDFYQECFYNFIRYVEEVNLYQLPSWNPVYWKNLQLDLDCPNFNKLTSLLVPLFRKAAPLCVGLPGYCCAFLLVSTYACVLSF